MVRIFLLVLSVMLAAAPLRAEVLARAEGMIREGNPAAALRSLAGYEPHSPATAQRMLWAQGVANMKLGQPKAALPVLERLVAAAPRAPEFRLELAAALGQLGQTERALYHIEIARSAGLPAEMDQRVAAYAQTLEKPKILNGHFSIAIVPESNAVKRTRATDIALFGLPFRINPEARAKAATGVAIGAGVVASPQIAPGWQAQVGLALTFRLFDGKATDDHSGRLFAGVTAGYLETGQTRAQVFTTRRILDSALYSRSNGVSLAHLRRVTPSTRIDGGVTVEDLKYRNGSGVRRNFISAGVTHLVHPQLELSFGVRMEDRRSDTATLAGQLVSARMGGQYRFKGGVQIGLSLDYERNRFDGISPLFQVKRQDRKRLARLELSKSQWNWKGFSPVLKITAERQSSTIVINEFRNFGAAFEVTRRF